MKIFNTQKRLIVMFTLAIGLTLFLSVALAQQGDGHDHGGKPPSEEHAGHNHEPAGHEEHAGHDDEPAGHEEHAGHDDEPAGHEEHAGHDDEPAGHEEHAGHSDEEESNAIHLSLETIKEFGIEIAKAATGHANISTTQIYAEKDLESAQMVALKFG